jgi:DNA-binding MarR family transcriptional regulator
MSSNDALKYIILNALDLSENEKAVLAVLEKQKLARNVSRIAKDAGVPRTTTTYILNKLRKWKIARRVYHEKRDHWMYNLR